MTEANCNTCRYSTTPLDHQPCKDCRNGHNQFVPAAGQRTFVTGATRDTDAGKPDYEGFLSPLVIERFGQYMTKHRQMADGSLRDSDNWQKGIPLSAYAKSGWRHFLDWWKGHRGSPDVDIEESLCALIFNAQGYLHEILKEKTRGAA